ncbi:translation initiation factor eIF2B subunit epsilon-like [Liolophura sinensis]|uniref:translation initiation factor eIF2B subunit epsilon-like n=1 Tax=Liolophura sinensis TaxID=3198878 RepID=UPI003158792D
MAPTTGKKSKTDDLKQEDVLQALVLADSFNTRFAPITQQRPRALLPLVNVPLLDYTLEFLTAAGVQEIIVYCCAHSDQIKKHIAKSKWGDNSGTCSVMVIVSEDSLSVGDALRDVDDKSLIRSDFVLVTGDVVANIRLKHIVEVHRIRREKEKCAVMTLIYKHASPGHKTRCREEDFVMAMESRTNRLLHYQKTMHQKIFEIPREVFTEHSDVELMYDCLDTHIAICSPLVPQLYKDNFDYQTRDDFVRGILINEEILGNTMHVHFLTDEYAARVSNVLMYDAISQDIINRWSFPFVPDVNISSHNTDVVSYGRHNIYRSQDVTLARGCVLEKNVVIGSGTSVGSNTTISGSVIGRNCKIGENVMIEGSYLWDGVTVEDNCTVTTAIICDHVTLYQGVTIQPGAILSWKVKVGPNVTVKPGSLLTAELVKEMDEWGESGEEDIPDAGIENPECFGTQAEAFVYNPRADIDDEDGDALGDVWGMPSLSEDEDEEEEVSSEDSFSEEGMSPSGSPPPDDSRLFYTEVLDTMERAKEENISTENTILEINSLKHAYNINIHDVNILVMKAVIEFPQAHTTLEPPQLLIVLQKHLIKHLQLIKNYIKSVESQRDCLTALEELSLGNPSIKAILVKLIHLLYEKDILMEQVIIQWYKDIPQFEEKDAKMAVRQQVAPLIQWLQEAEEESDEEDD